MKKIRHPVIAIFTNILITIFLCYVFQYTHNCRNDDLQEEIVEQNQTDNITGDSTNYIINDSVYNLIHTFRILYPDLVYKQAILESGHFKSNIFLSNNNAFGMKMPERRATTALYMKNGYAYYDNIRDCVIDYALYQNYIIRNKTRMEYLNHLQRNYAEDPNYKKALE